MLTEMRQNCAFIPTIGTGTMTSTHTVVIGHHQVPLPSHCFQVSHNIIHSKLNTIDILANIHTANTLFLVLNLFVYFVIFPPPPVQISDKNAFLIITGFNV